MCSYIVRKAALTGSAKGPSGWMRIDTANVYFDHPYHAPLDHALGIDFINAADGGRERVAVELSAQSARELVSQILAALASGEAEHGPDPIPGGHGGSLPRPAGERCYGAAARDGTIGAITTTDGAPHATERPEPIPRRL
jgi:hypothetical protein